MKSRAKSPTSRTKGGDDLAFRVWLREPSYLEDDKPWKCVAMFRFLGDCLDYIAQCQDIGRDIVFQSPADTREIKATDRRVVYKPEAV